jgi:hypothetical protein
LNLQENAARCGACSNILAGKKIDADADFTTLSRAIPLQKERMRTLARMRASPHESASEVQELLLRQAIRLIGDRGR